MEGRESPGPLRIEIVRATGLNGFDAACLRTTYADEPSKSTGGRRDNAEKVYSQAPLTGTIAQRPIQKTLNFKQAGELYRSFTDAEKTNLIKNLAGDLGQVKDGGIKTTIVSHFYQADVDYGTRLAKAVNVNVDEVKKAMDATK